jgi:23S rRNA pseudouridine1911/1915/1917 synthase
MKGTILYEDESIIVCEKPAGVPAQSDKTFSEDMVSGLKNYLTEQKKEPYIGLVHRLDRPVEGVMVFAKTPFAAKELSKQAADGRMKKYYLAVVCGKPEKNSGEFVDYLIRDGRTNKSSVVKKEIAGAKRAELKYQLYDTVNLDGETLSLVKIQLITGRHHQIRVQFANRGLPLFGDTKYNTAFAEKEGWFQIGLCAYKLEFFHPESKKEMDFFVEAKNPIFTKIQEIF